MIEDKNYLTQEEYEKEEKSQKAHRTFNTILSTILILAATFILPNAYNSIQELSEQVSGVAEQKVIESEIAHIAADEGYRPKVYKDSLGKGTVGFGHLVKPSEQFTAIDGHQAVRLLREDYTNAYKGVQRKFPWAEGEVKLVLVSMVYQMGLTGVENFKDTLKHLKAREYDLAAGEMLNSEWARTTPNRAGRLAARIMSLKGY